MLTSPSTRSSTPRTTPSSQSSDLPLLPRAPFLPRAGGNAVRSRSDLARRRRSLGGAHAGGFEQHGSRSGGGDHAGRSSAYDALAMEVVTRYARSDGVQIAYQVAGEGPLDVLIVPRWFSNIELDWDLPPSARFLTRLGSFARLIQFDRRGAGMSGGIAGATPLEEQIDDVRAVLEDVGSEQPALISIAEGCALAVLFAASHPHLVRALVLITPTPRVVRGPDYEWAQSVAERAGM